MRRIAASLAVCTSLASVMALAAPAHAAGYSTTLTCSGGALSVSTSSFSVADGDTITIIRGTGLNTPVATASGAGITPSGQQGIAGGPAPFGGRTFTIGSGFTGGTVALDELVNSCGAAINLTLTGGGGGGGGTPTTPTPVTETLSLAVAASGATCAGGNPSGTSGSWLTLPGADQCSQSGPTAKAGAKLLGWATTASFPVARAQAQIDKKWGVIDEVIDGVRMIFIPGGMATFVSGSNNLFPIWSA